MTTYVNKYLRNSFSRCNFPAKLKIIRNIIYCNTIYTNMIFKNIMLLRLFTLLIIYIIMHFFFPKTLFVLEITFCNTIVIS